MASIEITEIEVLALKKLALICNVLASGFKDEGAAKEHRALTKVLVDVVNRADRAALAGEARP